MSAKNLTNAENVPGVIAEFVNQRDYLVAFAVLDFLLGVGSGFLNGNIEGI
jgi:hypothetical protein